LNNPQPRAARRRLWLQVHGWIGVVLALPLSLVALTGAVLVFGHEIDAALNPALLRVTVPGAGAEYRPVAELIAAAKQGARAGDSITTFVFPRGLDSPALVLFAGRRPGARADDEFDVYVDPWTGRLLGGRIWTSGRSWSEEPFVSALYDFHQSLLIPLGGRSLVGILALAAMLSLLTGLLVWLPLGGQWRQAFTIAWRASRWRVLRDVHRAIGFYLLPVTFVLLFTGASFNLPRQFSAAAQLLPNDEAALLSTSATDAPVIDARRALEAASRAFPDGRLRMVDFPTDERDAFRVTQAITAVGLNTTRTISVDQRSGAVVGVADGARSRLGTAVFRWALPLHSGTAAGWPGRLLVLIVGLAVPTLAVTGVVQWRRNRERA
jgi:uncharacterized iron-regulated membrane protein